MPLCVLSVTCSTAQPCPSGKSSAFRPGKERQQPRQTLLVIDILDFGPGARRIGGDIVLQRHGNIDQATRHSFLPDFRRRAQTAPWRRTLLRSTPISSTWSSNRIAALEKAADLQPAAIADGAGAEELARMDRLVLRGVSENLGKENSMPSSPFARVSPLTRTSTFKRLRIAEFVRRDDPGPQHIRRRRSSCPWQGRAGPPFPPAAGRARRNR